MEEKPTHSGALPDSFTNSRLVKDVKVKGSLDRSNSMVVESRTPLEAIPSHPITSHPGEEADP